MKKLPATICNSVNIFPRTHVQYSKFYLSFIDWHGGLIFIYWMHVTSSATLRFGEYFYFIICAHFYQLDTNINPDTHTQHEFFVFIQIETFSFTSPSWKNFSPELKTCSKCSSNVSRIFLKIPYYNLTVKFYFIKTLICHYIVLWEWHCMLKKLKNNASRSRCTNQPIWLTKLTH
jgi:hypothetical protein